MKKKYLTFSVILLFLLTINAQTTTEYEHCKCTEIINYSENDKNLKDGKYKLKSEDGVIETGNYKEGLKEGIWSITNRDGVVVSEIEYSNGKLNGKYNLFNFDGDPKLNALFENNNPVGKWTYYSKKGKIIKQGKFNDGKASGVWKINKNNGKKTIFEYDFDNNESLISNNYKPKNPFLPRDDESGEYIIIYRLNQEIESEVSPFGGYIYSNELFVELLNVPIVLINTYTLYEFNVKASIKNGSLTVNDINYSPNKSNNPYFSFIADTNSPKNLKRIKHNDHLIAKMKERIFEALMVLGPWVSKDEKEIELSVPFVLNETDRM